MRACGVCGRADMHICIPSGAYKPPILGTDWREVVATQRCGSTIVISPQNPRIMNPLLVSSRFG